MVLEVTEVSAEFISLMNSYRQVPSKGMLLELCGGNVLFFAERMLGLELAVWQVSFLKTLQDSLEGRAFNITTGMTSRQIGKTTAVAVFTLWATLFNKKPETPSCNTNVVITSRDYNGAKKLLRDIRNIIRLGDRFMRRKYVDSSNNPLFGFFEPDGRYVGLISSLLSKDDPNNATMMTFEPWNEDKHGDYLLKDSINGSMIICIPPTPSALGNSFSIGIIDEAGHEDMPVSFWYDDLYPTGDATNAMWVMISTPWKPEGFFYDHIDPLDELGSSSYVNRLVFTLDALKDDPSSRAREQFVRVRKKIEIEYESKGKFDEIRRGYYCEFVKGDSNYFDHNKVDGVFDSNVSMIDSYDGVCDLGVDFGGSGKSHSVVTICRLSDEGVIERLYHYRYPVDKDLSLLDDIAKLMLRFNVQRVVVDDCLDKDTLVLMAEGYRKKISDIKPGEYVLSYNFKTKKYESKKVLKSVDKGLLPTKEIKFRNGTSAFATDSHEWFTISRNTGKVRVKNTKSLNNKLEYIPQAIGFCEYATDMLTIPEDVYAKAYLTGMYIAEGHRRPTKKAFFISQLKEDTRKILKNYLTVTDWVWQENKKGFYISDNKDYFDLWDAVGKGAQNKVIPEHIFTYWSKAELEAFAQGLIDGDGYIRKKGIDKRGFKYGDSVVYCTSSEQLAKDFKLLGNFIDKPSTIYSRVHSGFGSDKVQYEVVWRSSGSLTKGRTNIKEIVDGGIRHVWDIKVEDNESFILADSGVITHNCPSGRHLINVMELELGWDVTRFVFRKDKVSKYAAFKDKIYKGKVVSYPDDDLRKEMKALQNSKESRNSVIVAGKGYTDDLIDSFLIASFNFLEDRAIRYKFFSRKDVVRR